MRRLLATALMAATLLRPAVGSAHTQAGEAGLTLMVAVANAVYVPAKLLVAAGGLAVGAVVGLATGGDMRSAYAFWVPAASGTYILRPAHLDGLEPLEFFGSDYADTPSTVTGEPDSGSVYEALYLVN